MTAKTLRFFLKVFVLVSFLSLQLALAAPAGGSLSTTVKKKAQVKVPASSRWAGGVDMTRAMSLYDHQDGTKYDGMDYGAGLSYTLPWNGSLSSKLSVTQYLSPTEGEDTAILNDSHLAYKHSRFKIIENRRGVDLDWNPTFTGLIPLSKNSKDVDQINTALIAGAQGSLRAGDATNFRGLGLVFGVNAGQNFHQFETNKDGTILNKYSSNQFLSLYYSIRAFTLSTTYTNKIRWPYSGDVRNSFEFSQQVDYRFLKAYTASLGHTNSGSTLKPNGQDSNVSLMNEDSSIVYLGIGYSFGG